MTLTFIIIGLTLILFVMDRLPIDVVGLMALLAFMLSGILDPAEALAGFSAPIVLVLAGLFVVGEGLSRTGAAERFGEKILSISGTKERNLLCACMLAAAILSSFMSSTGAVAMLMPVVTQLARRLNLSPSRLLMPLAFAALFGGMLTLIGTPPNLVVNSELVRGGVTPFGFFSFTGPGLILLICGIGFILVASPRLLNTKKDESHPWENVAQEGRSGLTAIDLAQNYGLPGSIFRMGVRPTSKLTGKSVAEIGIRKKYHVTLLEIRPWDHPDESAEDAVNPETVIPMQAILMAHGKAEDVARFAQEEGLDILPSTDSSEALLNEALGIAEILILPRSKLIGKSLIDYRFHDQTGLHVLGILRQGKPLEGDISTLPLEFGDSLLVQGTWKAITLLRRHRQDIVLIEEPREFVEARQEESRRHAPKAMVILAGMLILMVGGWLPLVGTVFLGALLMILTGCLSSRQAYSAINWQSLVLIASMLPAAKAIEKTGGLTLIVEQFVTLIGPWGPGFVLAGLFLLTSVMSLLMSNTATSVILAPVAFQTAQSLGVQPEAFLMTVALAASTAFATPMASPVNTLVMSTGGYRFTDYLKLGLPLQFLIFVLTMIVVPLFFPFSV